MDGPVTGSTDAVVRIHESRLASQSVFLPKEDLI